MALADSIIGRSVLWELKGQNETNVLRCELDRPAEGGYRLCILRGRERHPFMVETTSDRQDAIRAGVSIYRQLKSGGWEDLSDEEP